MRPLTLLLVLALFGFGLGVALYFVGLPDEKPSAASSRGGARTGPALPTGVEGTALAVAANLTAGAPGAPESDVEILKGTIEYQAEQLELARQENARLRALIKQQQSAGKSGEDGVSASDDPDFDELATRVASLRKLDFSQPPVVSLESDDRLRERVSARLTAGLAPDHFVRMGRTYAILGFTELEVDLLPAVTECVLEASGGLVSSSGTEIWFFEEDNASLVKTTANRAAELASMLQRDHFEGPWPWQPVPQEEDGYLARLALARGDAGLIRFQIELAASAQSSNEGDALDGFLEEREYFEAPAFLREQLIAFPRILGGQFTLSIHESLGNAGVDEAQRNPPAHTAQILHPELYLEGGWQPDLPDWSAPEEMGEPIWGGVLGELDLLLYLKRYLPEPMAIQAAAGWAGDRVAVAGESAAEGEFVWELRFATEEDAAEAFHALRKSMSLRRNWALPSEDDLRLFRGSSPDRVGLVRRGASGRSVLVAEALTETRLGEFQKAIGW